LVEKPNTNLTIKHGNADPANLTRLSTKMMQAILVSLVSLSLALIRFYVRRNVTVFYPSTLGGRIRSRKLIIR
jgi:hypothetical protein